MKRQFYTLVQARIFRIAVTTSLIASVLGCSTNQISPSSITLKEPQPDQALVYLLRVPNDSWSFDVTVDGSKITTLPAETYASVNLIPGEHSFAVMSSSSAVATSASLTLQLMPNERRFIYLSGVNEKNFASSNQLAPILGVVGGAIGGAVAGLLASGLDTASGTHSWKECSELDARGFMSISTPQMSDQK